MSLSNTHLFVCAVAVLCLSPFFDVIMFLFFVPLNVLSSFLTSDAHVISDTLIADGSDVGLSVEEIASMYLNDTTSDVTLSLGDKKYCVHECVLSKRSPFFRGVYSVGICMDLC